MDNLKDEALYLASILCARLSDPVKGGDGRGLLSRALARGELDQFLVAFFSDPANLLFAREKVCAKCIVLYDLRAVLLFSDTAHASGESSLSAEQLHCSALDMKVMLPSDGSVEETQVCVSV